MNEIVINSTNGELTTSSLGVAEKFGKQHKDVLEAIEKLERGVAEKSADLFIETSYQHPQNKQWYKCYELTRDGFSLLVMGFTGKKALEWKLKYIEAFNLMEKKLHEQSQPPQMSQAEIIAAMANNAVESEKRLKSLEIKQQAMEERTEKVLDVFTMPTDVAWHEIIVSQFKKICYENNLNYHTTLGGLYSQLEREIGCNLSIRQKNKQKRMKLAGKTSKEITKATAKIMLIEDDDALRLAFENIFRKFQVKYLGKKMI